MAAENPGVSVVIPAYNYAHYLNDAVDSVLAQTYSPVEVIVVNDGSTDGTRELLDAYGDRIVAVHQENQGLSAARNTGIHRARYEFVAFLDADDAWEPDKLACQMECFRNLPETYGIVACDRGTMDEHGVRNPKATTFRKFPRPSREVRLGDMLLRSHFCPSAVVARRACFAQCGEFDTALRSSEDRDMWLRIAESWQVHIDDRVLCYTRKHSTNMSSNAERMDRNMRRVLLAARDRGKSGIASPLFWARVWSFQHFQTAWMHYEAKQRGLAFWRLFRSFLSLPWFPHPQEVDEGFLFRLRSLRLFLR